MENNINLLLTSPLLYVIVIFTLGSIAGFVGFFLGLKALIEVKALQKSTHNVSYMPIDPKMDEANEEFMDEWATSEKALKEQSDMFKDDLDDEMPMLAPQDEDKKKYSF
jgi:hypothetical protein